MDASMRFVRFTTAFTDIQDMNPSFALARLRIAYVGDNRNGSSIPKEVMEAAIPTLYNCPVVAHYDRATNSFGSHDVELVQEDDNHFKLINVTQPVGVVPTGAECFFETDADENGVQHEYLSTTVLLWKRQEAYEHICELTNIGESMEVVFDQCHIDHRGVLVADAMHFEAFCLLESAEPCYEGAELALFSSQKLLDFKQQYAQMISELKRYAAGSFSVAATKSQEGGEGMSLNETIIAEILAEFGLTVDALDFEITEDMTADQLREKASAFAADSADSGDTTQSGDTDESATEADPADDDNESDSTAEGMEPDTSEPQESNDSNVPVDVDAARQSFSATYRERRDAISNALDPIIDGDIETCFWLVDFDDNYAFVERDEINHATGAFEETNGRFTYTFNEESKEATITGDFEQMIMTWLTTDEYAALEQRRALLDDLIEFQERTLSKEYHEGVESIFALFTDLEGVDEFMTYRDHIRTLEDDKEHRPALDTVREHCYAIRGKRSQTFNQKLASSGVVRVSLPHAAPAKDDDDVGRLFAKHAKHIH